MGELGDGFNSDWTKGYGPFDVLSDWAFKCYLVLEAVLTGCNGANSGLSRMTQFGHKKG